MTASQFQTFWDFRYGNTSPIGHCLRDAYRERWLRIHSLPESKRYPEDESEWTTLLLRQNTLITDLLIGKFDISLVTAENYLNSVSDNSWNLSPANSLINLAFTPLEPISLGLIHPEYYDTDVIYRPIFTQVNWHPPAYDEILKDIAEDNLRMLFISIENQCLLAPYDGGVDIIFKDQTVRDFYKKRYSNWLSLRKDGF